MSAQQQTNLRNAVIILAIAAVVYAVPSAGIAVSFLTQAVSLAFLAAFAWIASRLYREHRAEIYSLGTRRRAIAYIAVGVAALAFSAVDRLWASGLGTVIWLLVLGGCGYALYAVYRSTREY
jgi:hypothetical protein